MTTTRLVVSSGIAGWQPKTKRNNKIEFKFSFGSSKSGVLVVLAIFLSAFFYLHLVNQSATRGFEARQAEKEISDLEKQNEQLRIKEAELKSLYYIEESSRKLNMADLHKVSYVEEKGPMALKR
jgi:hypothetical protein